MLKTSEEMARYFEVACVLYEVLRDVTGNEVDPQVSNCKLLSNISSFILVSLVNFLNIIFYSL
jgi:hypothetical protein